MRSSCIIYVTNSKHIECVNLINLYIKLNLTKLKLHSRGLVCSLLSLGIDFFFFFYTDIIHALLCPELFSYIGTFVIQDRKENH